MVKQPTSECVEIRKTEQGARRNFEEMLEPKNRDLMTRARAFEPQEYNQSVCICRVPVSRRRRLSVSRRAEIVRNEMDAKYVVSVVACVCVCEELYVVREPSSCLLLCSRHGMCRYRRRTAVVTQWNVLATSRRTERNVIRLRRVREWDGWVDVAATVCR